MPRKRATQVHAKSSPSYEGLDYPGPDDLNIPPESFDEYIRCFYGQKGSGKTTLVSGFPDYLTLMFETRRRNLKIRQMNLQKHTAEQIRDGASDVWQQIKNTTQRWLDDPTVKGLNFDSVDLAYESCVHSICAEHNINSPGQAGKSSADVWIQIRDEWAAYFDTLASTELGINFVSHVKEREVETVDGAKQGQQSPSCAPACLQYIRQACDFVFYFGYYQGKRAVCVRDETNMALVAVGPQTVFMQPDGKPVHMLELPSLTDKVTGYQQLVKGFNNELWDIDTPEDERESAPKKRTPKRRTR